MQTNLSNTTPEKFAARVAELRAQHARRRSGSVIIPPQTRLERQVAQFDALMESDDPADIETANKLGEKLMCPKTWKTRKPCGKQ